jgi:hypothetical protein
MDPKPPPERHKEGGLKGDKAAPPQTAPEHGPSVSEETGEPERDAGKPGGMAGEG